MQVYCLVHILTEKKKRGNGFHGCYKKKSLPFWRKCLINHRQQQQHQHPTQKTKKQKQKKTQF